MGYVKSSGVVIKEVSFGEADKIITVFAKGRGKITASAKGAKRPKSRLAAGTQLLCFSDFTMFKGKEIYSINSCEVIEPFYEMRSDVVKLTYAAHLIDIIDDVIQEEQPSSKVLQLFLNSLYMLAKTDKSPELIIRIFEIRLLSILGYTPYIRSCMECGTEEVANISFSFKKCGFLCRACLTHDPYAEEISQGTARALKYIVYAPMKDLYNFELSSGVLNELAGISKRYLRDRLERNFTKLDFLNELNTGNF
ncbi:MAG: DNA repair protein RecO [Clostridia bacterium]|nr:DNA repair protein RecO [Clostridia bacterium]